MSELFSPDFLFRNAILGGLGVALLCSRARRLPGAAPAGADRRRAAAGERRGRRRGVLADRARARGRRSGAPARARRLARRDLRRARAARARPAPRPQPGRVGRRRALRDQLRRDDPVRRAEPDGRHRDGEPAARRAARDHRLRSRVRWRGCCSWWRALLFLFRRELLLTSFDPEFARTIGREPAARRPAALLPDRRRDRARRDDRRTARGVRLPGAAGARGAARGARARAPRSRSPRRSRALSLPRRLLDLAYHADLPTGPVCVAVAAACWALASGVMRAAREPRARRRSCCWRSSRACSALPAARRASRRRSAERSAPLPRGTLPELGRVARRRRAAVRERDRQAAAHVAKAC